MDETAGAVPPPFHEQPELEIVRRIERGMGSEYRVNGKLYMIKVTPAAGAPYYLVDNQGDGNFIEANIPGPVTKPPMWVIHSW